VKKFSKPKSEKVISENKKNKTNNLINLE